MSDLTGCFDLSNAISVTRTAVNGGAIQIAGTTDTTASICVGEGVDDLIAVEFVDSDVLSGDSSTYVITDNATGDILGTPASGPFNLEGAPTGTCDIWYLRYTGDIGIGTATNVSDLTGCFDLSNAISVTRLMGSDCDALSINDFTADFNFKVYPNPTSNSVIVNYIGNSNVALKIQVIDMLGKEYYGNEFTENKVTIDLSNFSNGTYFLNILDSNTGKNTVKRVVKN